jgi:hypothetical protein
MGSPGIRRDLLERLIASGDARRQAAGKKLTGRAALISNDGLISDTMDAARRSS